MRKRDVAPGRGGTNRGMGRRAAAAATGLALLAGTLVAVPASAAAGTSTSGHDGPSLIARLLARQTLPAGDGWGSAGAGTTGGAAAAKAQVHVVSTRAELVEALGGDNATNAANDTPKTVFIRGTINGFEGPDEARLSCEDLADPEYDFEDYLATYDPAVWGRETDPTGPLEEARVRSVRNQQAQTVINVGANTTLYGVDGARLHQLTLMFNQVDNVIVRNLTFENAFDCYPRWRPTDGADGNWNSEWDYVSVRRGSNFWFDHNTFTTTTEQPPEYFGRKFETRDGQLDITHTADLVTVSHNVFRDHDKMMLIGSTDNPASGDPGLLNVTLRHNLFDGLGQRGPRVRFGKVDVYNNLYRVAVTGPFAFDYLWGVGVESQTYTENNFFDFRGADVDPAQVIRFWGGTAIAEQGTWARTGARGAGKPISLLDSYNAVNETPLGDDVGWTPELRRGAVLPAAVLPLVVPLSAGAGRLPG